MQYPPIFERFPSGGQFSEGSDARFELVIKGNPTPQVSWTRNGLPVNNTDRRSVSYDPHSGLCVLAIRRLGQEDDGDYRCAAVNSAGEAQLTLTIQCQKLPPQSKYRLIIGSQLSVNSLCGYLPRAAAVPSRQLSSSANQIDTTQLARELKAQQSLISRQQSQEEVTKTYIQEQNIQSVQKLYASEPIKNLADLKDYQLIFSGTEVSVDTGL